MRPLRGGGFGSYGVFFDGIVQVASRDLKTPWHSVQITERRPRQSGLVNISETQMAESGVAVAAARLILLTVCSRFVTIAHPKIFRFLISTKWILEQEMHKKISFKQKRPTKFFC